MCCQNVFLFVVYLHYPRLSASIKCHRGAHGYSPHVYQSLSLLLGDIHSHSFLAKLQKRKLRHYIDKNEISRFKIEEHAQELFNDEGEQELANPLLASWGKLGRDNLYFISQIDSANEISAFVDTNRNSLLENLQQDILDLENHAQLGTDLRAYSTSIGKRVLTLSDQSVTFHSCHSAQREVEVLQDKLLALFEQDSTLTPRDVIVMVSDIDSYTPFIQAVLEIPRLSDISLFLYLIEKPCRLTPFCRHSYSC